MSRPTQEQARYRRVFAYRAITFCGTVFHEGFPYRSANAIVPYRLPYNPAETEASTVWALPRSLAATSGISVDFSSYRY